VPSGPSGASHPQGWYAAQAGVESEIAAVRCCQTSGCGGRGNSDDRASHLVDEWVGSIQSTARELAAQPGDTTASVHVRTFATDDILIVCGDNALSRALRDPRKAGGKPRALASLVGDLWGLGRSEMRKALINRAFRGGTGGI
jgi:hypothetical protein